MATLPVVAVRPNLICLYAAISTFLLPLFLLTLWPFRTSSWTFYLYRRSCILRLLLFISSFHYFFYFFVYYTVCPILFWLDSVVHLLLQFIRCWFVGCEHWLYVYHMNFITKSLLFHYLYKYLHILLYVLLFSYSLWNNHFTATMCVLYYLAIYLWYICLSYFIYNILLLCRLPTFVYSYTQRFLYIFCHIHFLSCPPTTCNMVYGSLPYTSTSLLYFLPFLPTILLSRHLPIWFLSNIPSLYLLYIHSLLQFILLCSKWFFVDNSTYFLLVLLYVMYTCIISVATIVTILLFYLCSMDWNSNIYFCFGWFFLFVPVW